MFSRVDGEREKKSVEGEGYIWRHSFPEGSINLNSKLLWVVPQEETEKDTGGKVDEEV